MYTLRVIYRGEDFARDSQQFATGETVLNTIPMLLRLHPKCQQVEVRFYDVRLFAVDNEGNKAS